MVTHKRIAKLLQSWNLVDVKITNIYNESSGNYNHNAFYVGEEYVIKFSTNLGELKKHIAISKALSDAGFYCAASVPTRDGFDYIKDGELFCILTKRILGAPVNSRKIYLDEYTENARYIGEIIGQLHLVLENFSIDTANDVNLLEKLQHNTLPKITQLMDLPFDFSDSFLAEFKALYAKLPQQLIHRDPHPGNILLGAEHFAFIDFDLSEKNARIYDPCYASSAILSETFTPADDKKLAKWIDIYQNILYGYDSIVHLTEDEKKAMPYMILANQFICTAWFSEREKYVEIYKVNLEMTKWLIANKHLLALPPR